MHDGSNVEMSNVERLNVGGSWEDEEEEEQAHIVQLYIPEVFCYGHIITTTLGEEKSGGTLIRVVKVVKPT